MKYKKIALRALCTLALLAAVVMTTSSFTQQIRHALTAETYRTLSEVSKTYNKVFNDRISSTIATMSMLAGDLAEVHGSGQQELMKVLQNAVDEGGFTGMAVCNPQGITLSNNGTIGNVAHRDYFRKAISGKADVSEPLTLADGKEESIILAVPMQSHGVITGVLFGGYPLSVAGDHLLDTTYYSQGYGYIVAQGGAIILSSDHSDKMVDGKNLFDFFKKITFTDFSLSELRTALANGESGSFAYTYQGNRRFVSFTPASINDWYTFSLSSDAPMLQDEKATNQIVLELVAKLMAVATAVVAWIVLSNRRHNKKLSQREDELRLSEKRFSVAINASSGALFELDIRRQVYTHFENIQRVFGITTEELLADTKAFSTLPPAEFEAAVTAYFFHPDDCALIKTAMQALAHSKTASYEARLRRVDHRYLWCRVDLSLTHDASGEPSHLVGFISNIDTIKTQAILSEIQAQKDLMTGLYNKVAMATLANKSLKDDPFGQHALMVLDIDNFKSINDSLGHAFGDLVLIDVCTKLKFAFRSNDIVGRIGGDEFAILMKNVSDSGGVLKKGAELAEMFRQTYVCEKKECKISCSIGIILTDSQHNSFETLYRKADAALYQAKQNGKNQFVLYQEGDADTYPIEISKANDEEQQNLKKPYTLEAYIFELLYTAKDFESSIQMAMAAIGQQYCVSRVSIFEHSATGNTTHNCYEWCNEGITTTGDTMQNLQLSAASALILDQFCKTGFFACSDIRELPPHLRGILEEQHIQATLWVALFNDEKTFGFVGFDDCYGRRVWTTEELSKLSYLSKILGVFLFKKKVENSARQNGA